MVAFQFPKGYLTGAAVDQIEDVISQVLSEPPQTGATPQGFSNDDVIKMVQAKLPDSILIAKIKSSTCDFDTSPDALIKLKRAGVSDIVLNAIVEAPPPSSNLSDTPESPNTPAPACSNYDACMSAGKTALASSQWEDAIAVFLAASTLDKKKPDAWTAMGNAYLGEGRKEEAAAMWDKALAAGGPLTFAACHHRSFNSCEMGDLVLGPKNISFATAGGPQLFATPPAQVTSPPVNPFAATGGGSSFEVVILSLKAGAKNYRFQVMPFGISCQTVATISLMRCSEQGIAQALIISNYISQIIPKLASGTLGSSPP